ncbi:MAG: putative DNA modification/repair radical SAM protein [Verrucomicrobiota bacterium]
MEFKRKLEILADAAKYDASCASSGATRRDSGKSGGIGSAGSVGICHSYAPDGRCISLLKILMTNVCIYDCHFCINRRSSNVERARMTVEEIVRLTMNFYKRNYIEGLFLSSGIIRSADYTMEQVVRVAKELRETHQFKGYIHLKTIPEASPELIEQAGSYADRISINIELPKEESLRRLAPEKNLRRTQNAMGEIRTRIEQCKEENREARKNRRRSKPGSFATGQSTQMIIGADDSSDTEILKRSDILYNAFRLKRVYFSAFSPIPSASTVLPLRPPPLIREHRLYQADWLMRFYGFQAAELTSNKTDKNAAPGNLDLDIDPKLSWALRHRAAFPVDINQAPREMLLRIPGIGVQNVQRILHIRRWTQLRLGDLTKLRISLKKCIHFIITADHRPRLNQLDSSHLRQTFAPRPEQSEFNFALPVDSAETGKM